MLCQELDYFIKNNMDTTYCSSIMFARSSSLNIKYFSFYDMGGKQYNIEGKSQCEEISSFRQDGKIFDLINLKGIYPGEKNTHYQRKVDGRVKLYYFSNELSIVYRYEDKMPYSICVVKLEDGRLFRVTKKNHKKYIMPRLEQNEIFKKSFNNFTKEEKKLFFRKRYPVIPNYIKMLRLYNSNLEKIDGPLRRIELR